MDRAARLRTMSHFYLEDLADMFEHHEIRSADLTVHQREAVHAIVLTRELRRQRDRAQLMKIRRRRAA
jgi:hypothetical protein